MNVLRTRVTSRSIYPVLLALSTLIKLSVLDAGCLSSLLYVPHFKVVAMQQSLSTVIVPARFTLGNSPTPVARLADLLFLVHRWPEISWCSYPLCQYTNLFTGFARLILLTKLAVLFCISYFRPSRSRKLILQAVHSELLQFFLNLLCAGLFYHFQSS